MNNFEKVSDEINGTQTFTTSSESAIEWVGNGKDTLATVTFPSGRFKSKIERLAADHPDDVKIRHRNPDGSIVATVPIKYIKLSAPRVMSEEQKQVAAERMKKLVAVRKHKAKV